MKISHGYLYTSDENSITKKCEIDWVERKCLDVIEVYNKLKKMGLDNNLVNQVILKKININFQLYTISNKKNYKELKKLYLKVFKSGEKIQKYYKLSNKLNLSLLEKIGIIFLENNITIYYCFWKMIGIMKRLKKRLKI